MPVVELFVVVTLIPPPFGTALGQTLGAPAADAFTTSLESLWLFSSMNFPANPPITPDTTAIKTAHRMRNDRLVHRLERVGGGCGVS